MYIYSVFYFPVIAFVQIAILIFYRRIFYPTTFRLMATVCMAICAAWLAAALVIEIGYPGHEIGDFFEGSTMKKFNVNYLSFWLAMSIIETLVELIILVLPIRELHRLQLSARKKYLCSTIFALGGFVIITGIVRIIKVYKPTGNEVDLTQGDIWINAHLGTAIICACLPTYRPLFSRRPWISHKIHSFHIKGSSNDAQSHKLPTIPKDAHLDHSTDTMDKLFAGRPPVAHGTYTDARHRENSSTAETPWQDERAVRDGAAIAVKQTVDVV